MTVVPALPAGTAGAEPAPMVSAAAPSMTSLAGGLASAFVVFKGFTLLRTASNVATEVAEATGEMTMSAVGSATGIVTDSAQEARLMWHDVLGLVRRTGYLVATMAVTRAVVAAAARLGFATRAENTLASALRTLRKFVWPSPYAQALRDNRDGSAIEKAMLDNRDGSASQRARSQGKAAQPVQSYPLTPVSKSAAARAKAAMGAAKALPSGDGSASGFAGAAGAASGSGGGTGAPGPGKGPRDIKDYTRYFEVKQALQEATPMLVQHENEYGLSARHVTVPAVNSGADVRTAFEKTAENVAAFRHRHQDRPAEQGRAALWRKKGIPLREAAAGG